MPIPASPTSGRVSRPSRATGSAGLPAAPTFRGYGGKSVKVQFTSRGDVSELALRLVARRHLGLHLRRRADHTDTDTDAHAHAPAVRGHPVKAQGKVEKAVVKWAAPATNPTTVTGYRVSTAGSSVTVGASSLKAVIKGLKQGKTYAFSVEALGANGFVAPARRRSRPRAPRSR